MTAAVKIFPKEFASFDTTLKALSDFCPPVFVTSRTVRLVHLQPSGTKLLRTAVAGQDFTGHPYFFQSHLFVSTNSLVPSWRAVLLANLDAAAFTMSYACCWEREPYDSAGAAMFDDGLPALASLKHSFSVGNPFSSVLPIRTHNIAMAP